MADVTRLTDALDNGGVYNTGGEALDFDPIAGGRAVNVTADQALAVEMGAQLPVVLYARSFTGTPTLDAAYLRWREQW